MITRFAPSPTGHLHLGHVLAAKTAFEFSNQCLLRIEDIDFTRCRPEYTQAIYRDLEWLGFNWPSPVRVQSEHMDDYKKVTKKLHEDNYIYPCFKTRNEIPKGIYTGPNRPLSVDEIQSKLDAGETPAWRLNMAKARDIIGPLSYRETGLSEGLQLVNPFDYGDIVLARKDIGTSYLIACTHDDAMQGVTHVVRGADFTELTGAQRILQALMGWPEPVYHHHALLTNADGEKLAKRNKDTSILSLREKGFSPSDVLDMASAAQSR